MSETQTEKKVIKKTIDVNEMVDIFEKRIDDLTKTFSYHVQEHPRAANTMKRLGQAFKEMIREYFYDDKIPVDEGPSEAEKLNSISMLSQKQKQEVRVDQEPDKKEQVDQSASKRARV